MGKFLGICGNQRQIENERVTGNQQIVRTDWRSCCLQFKAKQAGPATRISSERNFFNNVHQGLYSSPLRDADPARGQRRQRVQNS